MAAIKATGIDVRFKAFEGCYRGFEITSPDTAIVRKGRDFTFDSYAEFYDTCAV